MGGREVGRDFVMGYFLNKERTKGNEGEMVGVVGGDCF